MNCFRIALCGFLTNVCLFGLASAGDAVTLETVQPVAANSAEEPLAAEFSLNRASEFLDSAALDWTKSRKCFTCHTNYAYLLARPAIGHDCVAHQQVRSALEELVNIRWESDGPRWDAEVVMSAMVLAFNDATTSGKLHDATRKSLDRMWTVQKEDGGFDWLKCDWPPMESDDHYGATVALIAAGVAPDRYVSTEQARSGIARIKTYLKSNPPPTLHHSAMVLWAATCVEGILERSECDTIIQDLLALQKPDGGWCLASLGDWKRSDDKQQDTQSSDGYATGFVVYVLRRAGLEAVDPRIRRGVDWLKSNQRLSGRWFTRSLNSDSKHFISHAGTAFAVLALAACENQTEPPEVTAVVGKLSPEEGGTSETDSSSLNAPFGVDFDSQGNMFINEMTGGRLFKRDSNGVLTRIAGDGSEAYAGDNGPASSAKFHGTHNVAATPNGSIYISDSFNHCIRKIDPTTQIISTFAGTGQPGFSGDGGLANKATFNDVMCITFSRDYDRLYVVDLNNRRVRVIDMRTGVVTTVAGNGERGVPADGTVAIQSPLVDPRAVAVDSSDNVYILERSGHALRLVTRDGRIVTVAGTGEAGSQDGPKGSSRLNGPKHLCVDDQNNVYIADDQNHLIRKYDPRGQTLTTVLGRKSGDRYVRLKNPHGVCFEAGSLYVVDSGNNRILRMATRSNP